MKLTDPSIAIRVAVHGEWVPPQLADLLALQRAEEPETVATLIEWTATDQMQEPPSGGFDFALSSAVREWSGRVCEPLWHDTLAVAVPKRSPLLAYREVPRQEALKQPLICSQSTAGESWRTVARGVFDDELHGREETVSTFDVAMTLVSAGYGITIAPAARLADYRLRGIALRPLAGAPAIVMTYLLRPHASLTAAQARFARRARSVS